MPKINKTDEALITTARRTHDAALDNEGEFFSRFKHHKKKPIDRPFIATFATMIRTGTILMTSHAGAEDDQLDASAAEEAARAALRSVIVDIRDDVATQYEDRNPKNDAIRREFGAGADINSRSTVQLVKVSASIQNAFDTKKGMKDAAGHAGVTPKRIKELEKLRQKLTLAKRAHGKAIATARGLRLKKIAGLAKVTKTTGKIRVLAKRAFKGRPEILVQFGLATGKPRTKRTAKGTKANGTDPAPGAANKGDLGTKE